MIQALIGPIASLASSWMESKVESTKAKGRVALAKADAEAELMKHEAGWEKVMADPRMQEFGPHTVGADMGRMIYGSFVPLVDV